MNAKDCPNGFDQALLTGYLDSELNQEKEQRVRLHLEDCTVCREFFGDMGETREVSMNTRFAVPKDDQWNEAPRGVASFTARWIGWALLMVWCVALAGYGLWQFLTSPGEFWVKLSVFGLLSGVGLLFISVLIDRIKASRTDRYNGVEK